MPIITPRNDHWPHQTNPFLISEDAPFEKTGTYRVLDWDHEQYPDILLASDTFA